MSFVPKLDVLPASQRALWPELSAVPPQFVLYGGTGLALRLGHRQSVDFDFFGTQGFDPGQLRKDLPFLRDAQITTQQENLLNVVVNRGGAVKVQFIGGISFGRVGDPEWTEDRVLRVASLLDIAAGKLAAIWNRTQPRDYVDVDALLRHGVNLPEALAAARAIYGEQFNPMISLRALASFVDGDLPGLPAEVKRSLATAAGRTSLEHLPVFQRRPGGLAPDAASTILPARECDGHP